MRDRSDFWLMRQLRRFSGRDIAERKTMEKLDTLYDHYHAQGNYEACSVVCDVVAWLQDDFDAMTEYIEKGGQK